MDKAKKGPSWKGLWGNMAETLLFAFGGIFVGYGSCTILFWCLVAMMPNVQPPWNMGGLFIFLLVAEGAASVALYRMSRVFALAFAVSAGLACVLTAMVFYFGRD